MLFEFCHKLNKRIDIRYWKDGKSSIAGVYLNDEFFASGRAEHRDIAKLIPAKEALRKLVDSTPIDMVTDEDSLEIEPEDAKMKLYEICNKKKWPKPIYNIEESESVGGKRFECSAKIKIPTEEGTLYMKGDEQSKKKKAENSSAYHMIRALRKSKYL